MAGKTKTKKNSGKASKKTKSKKIVKSKAASKKVKTKKKPAPKKKAAPKKVANRRSAKRYETRNLWVTERSGDYQFVVSAENISEGGIFLKGRMRTTAEPSLLTIHLKKTGTLNIEALPLYDRMTTKSYGAGYQFVGLTKEDSKKLKSFLRNLD